MKHDDDKLTRILDAAADLFAKHPFHKVLLSDVARTASVGKGTLYLYFKSKDDLYFGVLLRSFASLLDKLQKTVSETDVPADEQMRDVICILTEHLFKKAINMELLGCVMTCPSTDEWRDKRMELWGLLESLIRRGIDQGVFEDATPRLTAQYIPALLRSVCLSRPEGQDVQSISDHACTFILRGLEINK